MAENFNVTLELKDISESDEAMAEMIALGGKNQTPFLHDQERTISLYESSDIIDHLREFGKQASPIAVSRPRVHVGGSVCESCEG